jgi:hypothetical protein
MMAVACGAKSAAMTEHAALRATGAVAIKPAVVQTHPSVVLILMRVARRTPTAALMGAAPRATGAALIKQGAVPHKRPRVALMDVARRAIGAAVMGAALKTTGAAYLVIRAAAQATSAAMMGRAV